MAREKIEETEFSATSYESIDPEIEEIKITILEIAELRLIEVSWDGATYNAEFSVGFNAIHSSTDYSHAIYDREDGVHYGMEYSSHLYTHDEHFSATIEISFKHGLRKNAKIIYLKFYETIFYIDIDSVQYIREIVKGYDE